MRKFLLVAALVLLTPAMAAADLLIQGSRGGRIGDYLELFMLVREQGRRVVIDGPCLSACTLVLGVVPRDRICITPRAVLGFHAAWNPDANGRPRTHAEATRLMLATYPSSVRKWIRRKGGLTARTILLRGRELRSLYPYCG